MPGLSHVRLRFWDSERYTDAQAQELRRLRELYTTYLVPAFGPAMPDIFALRTEGNEYYPRYTATTLTPLLPTSVPPSAPLGARPLKPFADALLTTLAVFEAGRVQRWLGKGHPNDPTRLLGLFIRQTCERWLTHAPMNATTLGQVTALRRYVDALARDRLFTNEGQDHGSMGILLHNLGAPLVVLEKRLQQEIRLQSAREHFAEVKAQVGEALEEGARYLFHALAEHDRTTLPFSWINVHTQVISAPLSKALQSREGLLLKQWLYAPGPRRVLLPEPDQKDREPSDPAPISLLGSETPTPLLDEKGQADPTWVGFLTQHDALAEQLTPAFREVPVGICPVLLSADPHLIADAIHLHGLMETLAEYQFYVHQCWQLAGFGGDHCVYDQMVEAVTSILGELRAFSQKLRERLQAFQEKLDTSYRHALEAGRYAGWQANYRKAKAAQEQWLALLQGCETHLDRLLAHAMDRRAQAERRDLAEQAYQTLRAAPPFLNRARQQVGLVPRPHYPGLVAPAAVPLALPTTPSLASIHWDQVTTGFLSTSPDSAAWLGELCNQTPSDPPWRLFRGSYRRHCYLQDADRLKRLYQTMEQLQLTSASPLTPERKARIEQCQRQLREEQARIQQLQQGLWWPFHRASIRFFELWSQGMVDQQRRLTQALAQAVSEGVATLTMRACLSVDPPRLESEDKASAPSFVSEVPHSLPASDVSGADREAPVSSVTFLTAELISLEEQPPEEGDTLWRSWEEQAEQALQTSRVLFAEKEQEMHQEKEAADRQLQESEQQLQAAQKQREEVEQQLQAARQEWEALQRQNQVEQEIAHHHSMLNFLPARLPAAQSCEPKARCFGRSHTFYR